MKVARLAAALLPFVFCMSTGCSDPPSPPAQAALTLQTTNAAGRVCTTQNGQLSVPFAQTAGVLDELNCDLSMGCHPDDYVVVDRDTGATVTCTVSPQGGNYYVSLNLQANATATSPLQLSFQMQGNLQPSGGMAGISQTNSVAMGGGRDDACTVTIAAPFGVIAKGKVWGSFKCENFRDQVNIGDTGCEMTGQFLFENCGG